MNSILAGEKTVEFRKQLFRQPIKYVALYASSPVMKVVAYCEVDSIDVGRPLGVWKKYKDQGGISFSEYKDYYKGCKMAVVYRLKDIEILEQPLALAKVKRGLKAPQNYTYLSSESFEKIKRSF